MARVTPIHVRVVEYRVTVVIQVSLEGLAEVPSGEDVASRVLDLVADASIAAEPDPDYEKARVGQTNAFLYDVMSSEGEALHAYWLPTRFSTPPTPPKKRR